MGQGNWMDVCFGLCLINTDKILPSSWTLFTDEVGRLAVVKLSSLGRAETKVLWLQGAAFPPPHLLS